MAVKTAKETEVIEAKNEKDYWNEPVKIKIPISREHTDDLFVAVNDRTFLIQRGHEVEVPRCVAEVIAQSEQADYEALLNSMALQEDYEEKAKKRNLA